MRHNIQTPLAMLKYAGLLTLALLAACEVGPDYKRPPNETPAAYKESGDWQLAEPQDDIDRAAWWSIYNDPILDKLERQIDISNQNLKAAEAAFRLANATVDEANASLFPTLSLGAGSSTSNNGQSHAKAVTLYNLSGSATWVPDLWGGIRRTVESDEANAQASAAQIASARLSAQATLATDYMNLRSQDELKRLLNATVQDDVRALQIVQNQYDAGIAAKADVLLARTELESVQAQAINVDVERTALEHAIAVLIGKPPSEFILAPAKYAQAVPNVPTGVPSTLLERRPDIANAERLVASANAQIGVETSAWFPNLTLSGSAGFSAVAIGKLLQLSSNMWSLGPTLAETIFDAGAREARVEEAEANYDETVATYRQTVLAAFQQVEDNLSALRVLADEEKAERATVADARQSVTLTLNQYKEGIVPYSSILTAQITALGNEQNAIAVHVNRIDASILLIEALGGGWDTAQIQKTFDHPPARPVTPEEPQPDPMPAAASDNIIPRYEAAPGMTPAPQPVAPAAPQTPMPTENDPPVSQSNIAPKSGSN
jgi:NodT family efflux transporter outer membrane factor (OMF) lipoprotein